MSVRLGFIPLVVTMAAAAALFAAIGPASARTASFVSPATLSGAELAAVSTRGDSRGLTVGLGQSFSIVFDQPIGLIKNADNVSIFTLAPPVGSARAVISIGRYNSGSPIILRTQNLNSGNTFSIGNLFQIGCAQIGGCNFVSITTDRTQRGAAGVVVDYIVVNGEVTDVTSPTPEPRTWALMIIGFIAVAARLKRRRAAMGNAYGPLLSPSSG